MKGRERRVALQHLECRDDPDDSQFVDAGSIRGDGRSTVQGTVIVGHLTRESFMEAVSRPVARATGEVRDTPPVPELTEECERQLYATLLAAFAQPRPREISPPDLRAEGRNRMARNRERPML
jgi:hypothetical protein